MVNNDPTSISSSSSSSSSSSGKLTPRTIEEEIRKWQEKQQKELEAQRSQLTLMRYVIIAVVVILTAAFISAFFILGGLVQERIATRSATYQDLVNKVNEQNIKIDLLFDELRKTNSKLLEIGK